MLIQTGFWNHFLSLNKYPSHSLRRPALNIQIERRITPSCQVSTLSEESNPFSVEKNYSKYLENGHSFSALSIGLWKECGLDTDNVWKCRHISNDMLSLGHVGSWINFVRVLVILAVIVDVVAVLFIFVTFFWKPKLYFTSSIASLLTCKYIRSSGVFKTLSNIHDEES